MTMTTATIQTHQQALARLLNPKTIGVAGMKTDHYFMTYIERTLKHSDAEIYWINPRVDEVNGEKTYPSIGAVPVPLDAIFVANGAEVAVTYAEEAAELGTVGGLILVSGGFAEQATERGIELQNRLKAAADKGGFAVAGPNGLGLVNVPLNVSLAMQGDYAKRRPGGISLVSQSGAVLHGIVLAGGERPPLGFKNIISAGNEAVTDLADYVNYFADDPDTTAIGLVIEKIRRPKEFFAAARKAILAGKPIVALKLARSARTQELAASHTGSLTGDAWVYEVAFKQLGIGLARDPDELIDRLAIIEQLDPKFWNKAENLAVLTFTGGYASMATDLAADEGVNVPPLDELRPWIQALIPGVVVANPLDTASAGGPVWDEILEKYGTHPGVDVAMIVHPLGDEDGGAGSSIVDTFARASEKYGKPFIVVNCATALGDWAQEIVDSLPGAATGYGPRSALRGIETLGHFVRAREKLQAEARVVPVLPRPSGATIQEPEGKMLNFADAMALLESAGIPPAPFHLIPLDAEVSTPSFAGPYVVKLADVGHRTEHGAVLLKITEEGLADAVATLRAIAERDGLQPLVAVQPMASFRGEAFIGLQNSELGPLVVFGLGGIFVEVLKKVGGRLAPFDRSEAESLIEEFRDAQLLHGFRGQPAWNLDRLADLLVAAGDLAAGSAEWLDSLDVNPLLVVGDDYLAVDALVIVRD